MEKISGRNIPRTLQETCDLRRMALLVYDMQVGIVSQLPHGPEVTQKVAEVLGAAREGGFPVFFSRHMSLPKELMGVFQLRQAMAWQRVDNAEAVRSPSRKAPHRGKSYPISNRSRARRSPTRLP